MAVDNLHRRDVQSNFSSNFDSSGDAGPSALHAAGYPQLASFRHTAGERQAEDAARQNMQALIKRADWLDPSQKQDAEHFVDAILNASGRVGKNSHRAEEIESKYKSDERMSKLLKNIRREAQVSFD
ncbi:MAG TPA: hypothetical protein V6C89_00355 [Drouetiella sp.]|jgi:hypothetical protein